jgi:hypothetical protein
VRRNFENSRGRRGSKEEIREQCREKRKRE